MNTPSTKLPSITILYNRHKTASQYKRASVEIRIYYSRKQKYISTGIMLYPHQWKRGKIVNCPDIIEISQQLDTLIKNIRQVLIEMIDCGHVDIFTIPNKLKAIKSKSITFIEFCKQRTTLRKYGKAPGTCQRYDIFLKLFIEWGVINTFSDVTEGNIIAFDKYLDSKHLKTYSKWSNYHKFLNAFIIDAINENYIQSNPYKVLSISKERDNDSIKKHLTVTEFERLKQVHLSSAKLERVRDVFVFQTYTCLSYADLKRFDISSIQEVKGRKVYLGHRTKTSKGFTIPLLPSALYILNKYNGKLPIISNVKYNEYLKIIALAADIDKPISSHWARHTGATLLLNEGVPMQIVSRICGHSSIKITEQIYANLLDETVVDAVTNLNI